MITHTELYDNCELYFNEMKFNVLGIDIERYELYEYGEEAAVYSFVYNGEGYSFSRSNNMIYQEILKDINNEIKRLIRKRKIDNILK